MPDRTTVIPMAEPQRCPDGKVCTENCGDRLCVYEYRRTGTRESCPNPGCIRERGHNGRCERATGFHAVEREAVDVLIYRTELDAVKEVLLAVGAPVKLPDTYDRLCNLYLRADKAMNRA